MARKRKTDEMPVAMADGKELRPGQSYKGIEYRGKNKDGQDVWRIVVYRGYKVVTTPDGKQKRITQADKHTFTGTFREAKKLKAKLETDREEGTYTSPTRITFGDFLRRWLDTTARRMLKAKTHEVARINIEKHIIPGLGHIPLQKLTTRDIDDYYQSKIEELSPATIKKHHSYIRKALAKARAEGLIRQNPAIEATPPRVPKPKATVLTQEQLDALLEAAKDSRYFALIYTIAYTGLRLGEALGLKWEDVDLEAGTLHVTETFDERDGDMIEWGDGKTDASRRVVRISPDVAAVLRRHKKEQEWLKRLEGDRYKDFGLVFATETGFPPSPSNLRQRYLYPACEKAGVPRVTFHQLRHTHATLLLKAGVHPRIVQERLGHSSFKMTMDRYSHVMPDMQDDALARYAVLREEVRRRAGQAG